MAYPTEEELGKTGGKKEQVINAPPKPVESETAPAPTLTAGGEKETPTDGFDEEVRSAPLDVKPSGDANKALELILGREYYKNQSVMNSIRTAQNLMSPKFGHGVISFGTPRQEFFDATAGRRAAMWASSYYSEDLSPRGTTALGFIRASTSESGGALGRMSGVMDNIPVKAQVKGTDLSEADIFNIIADKIRDPASVGEGGYFDSTLQQLDALEELDKLAEVYNRYAEDDEGLGFTKAPIYATMNKEVLGDGTEVQRRRFHNVAPGESMNDATMHWLTTNPVAKGTINSRLYVKAVRKELARDYVKDAFDARDPEEIRKALDQVEWEKSAENVSGQELTDAEKLVRTLYADRALMELNSVKAGTTQFFSAWERWFGTLMKIGGEVPAAIISTEAGNEKAMLSFVHSTIDELALEPDEDGVFGYGFKNEVEYKNIQHRFAEFLIDENSDIRASFEKSRELMRDYMPQIMSGEESVSRMTAIGIPEELALEIKTIAGKHPEDQKDTRKKLEDWFVVRATEKIFGVPVTEERKKLKDFAARALGIYNIVDRFSKEHPYMEMALDFSLSLPMAAADPLIFVAKYFKVAQLTTKAKKAVSAEKGIRESGRATSISGEKAFLELSNDAFPKWSIQNKFPSFHENMSQKSLVRLIDDFSKGKDFASGDEILRAFSEAHGGIISPKRLKHIVEAKGSINHLEAATLLEVRSRRSIVEKVNTKFPIEDANVVARRNVAIDEVSEAFHGFEWMNASNPGEAMMEKLRISISDHSSLKGLTPEDFIAMSNESRGQHRQLYENLLGAGERDSIVGTKVNNQVFADMDEYFILGVEGNVFGKNVKFGLTGRRVLDFFSDRAYNAAGKYGKGIIDGDLFRKEMSYMQTLDKVYPGITKIAAMSKTYLFNPDFGQSAQYAAFNRESKEMLERMVSKNVSDKIWVEQRVKAIALKHDLNQDEVWAVFDKMLVSPAGRAIYAGTPRVSQGVWDWMGEVLKSKKAGEEVHGVFKADLNSGMYGSHFDFDQAWRLFTRKKESDWLYQYAGERGIKVPKSVDPMETRLVGGETKNSLREHIYKEEAKKQKINNPEYTKEQAYEKAVERVKMQAKNELPDFDKEYLKAIGDIDELISFVDDIRGGVDGARVLRKFVLKTQDDLHTSLKGQPLDIRSMNKTVEVEESVVALMDDLAPYVQDVREQLRLVKRQEQKMIGQMEIEDWVDYSPVIIDPQIAASIDRESDFFARYISTDGVNLRLNKNFYRDVKAKGFTAKELNEGYRDGTILMNKKLQESLAGAGLGDAMKAGIFIDDTARALMFRKMATAHTAVVDKVLGKMIQDHGWTKAEIMKLPADLRGEYMKLDDAISKMGSGTKASKDVYIPKTLMSMVEANLDAVGLTKMKEISPLIQALTKFNAMGRGHALFSVAFPSMNIAGNFVWATSHGVSTSDVVMGGYAHYYAMLKDYGKQYLRQHPEKAKEFNAKLKAIGGKTIGKDSRVTLDDLAEVAANNQISLPNRVFDDLIGHSSNKSVWGAMEQFTEDFSKHTLSARAESFLDLSTDIIIGARGPLKWFYGANGHIESVFRVGGLYSGMRKGMSASEAVAHSRHTFLDYTRKSRFTIMARESFLPFFNFTANEFKQVWGDLLRNPTAIMRQLDIASGAGLLSPMSQALPQSYVSSFMGTRIVAPEMSATPEYPDSGAFPVDKKGLIVKRKRGRRVPTLGGVGYGADKTYGGSYMVQTVDMNRAMPIESVFGTITTLSSLGDPEHNLEDPRLGASGAATAPKIVAQVVTNILSGVYDRGAGGTKAYAKSYEPFYGGVVDKWGKIGRDIFRPLRESDELYQSITDPTYPLSPGAVIAKNIFGMNVRPTKTIPTVARELREEARLDIPSMKSKGREEQVITIESADGTKKTITRSLRKDIIRGLGLTKDGK